MQSLRHGYFADRGSLRPTLLILARPLAPDWPSAGMCGGMRGGGREPTANSTIIRIADGQSSPAVARRSLLAFAGPDRQRCDETVTHDSGRPDRPQTTRLPVSLSALPLDRGTVGHTCPGTRGGLSGMRWGSSSEDAVYWHITTGRFAHRLHASDHSIIWPDIDQRTELGIIC